MIFPGSLVASRYRIVKLLGSGGMKQVYVAEDLHLAARRCALAEMIDAFPNAAMRAEAEAAFKREAERLRKWKKLVQTKRLPPGFALGDFGLARPGPG